jgi:hypothetical protein
MLLAALYLILHPVSPIILTKLSYVMIVKDNQPKLLDDVKTVFHGPFSHLLEKSSSQTLDLGHGRIEERSLTASAELSGYSD